MWLGKKTQNLPSSCTGCRLSPHDQLGRLCVSGMYKRPLSAPTKENALALIAVDIGGKNTQEKDQIRIWAAPTAGPETSTVLEGILGRGGGLWLPVRERMLTAVTQKNIYYSYFLICSVDSFGFFPFFLISFPPLYCSCWYLIVLFALLYSPLGTLH